MIYVSRSQIYTFKILQIASKILTLLCPKKCIANCYRTFSGWRIASKSESEKSNEVKLKQSWPPHWLTHSVSQCITFKAKVKKSKILESDVIYTSTCSSVCPEQNASWIVELNSKLNHKFATSLPGLKCVQHSPAVQSLIESNILGNRFFLSAKNSLQNMHSFIRLQLRDGNMWTHHSVQCRWKICKRSSLTLSAGQDWVHVSQVFCCSALIGAHRGRNDRTAPRCSHSALCAFWLHVDCSHSTHILCVLDESEKCTKICEMFSMKWIVFNTIQWQFISRFMCPVKHFLCLSFSLSHTNPFNDKKETF